MATHLNVEHKNWFQRIKDALFGVPMGIIYIIVATWALIHGEKVHAKTTNLLKKIDHEIHPAEGKKIDPALDHELVLVSDSVTTKNLLYDSLFHIKGRYISMYRQVKMCQWQETITKKSHEEGMGGKVDSVTYEYHKVWSSKLINDGKFKYKDVYKNPKSMLYQPKTFTAKDVRLGAYHVSTDLKSEFKKYVPLDPALAGVPPHHVMATDTFRCLAAEVASNAALYSNHMLSGGYLFKGEGQPSNPMIGDYKFVYWVVPPATYSVIAEQSNDSLKAKRIEDGFALSELNCGTNFNYETNRFLIILSGQKNKKEMLTWAHEKNDIMLAIGLRLWGFIFMVAGFRLVFRPLAILPAWIPIVGRYAGKAILRVSFLLATTVTFLVAGVTWLIYNNVGNITKWDYYFLILVFLIFIGAVRVRASMGEHNVDSGDVFNVG